MHIKINYSLLFYFFLIFFHFILFYSQLYLVFTSFDSIPHPLFLTSKMLNPSILEDLVFYYEELGGFAIFTPNEEFLLSLSD